MSDGAAVLGRNVRTGRPHHLEKLAGRRFYLGRVADMKEIPLQHVETPAATLSYQPVPPRVMAAVLTLTTWGALYLIGVLGWLVITGLGAWGHFGPVLGAVMPQLDLGGMLTLAFTGIFYLACAFFFTRGRRFWASWGLGLLTCQCGFSLVLAVGFLFFAVSSGPLSRSNERLFLGMSAGFGLLAIAAGVGFVVVLRAYRALGASAK